MILTDHAMGLDYLITKESGFRCMKILLVIGRGFIAMEVHMLIDCDGSVKS